MNLPNTLTIMRFFLVPVYVFCYFEISKPIAFLIVLFAGITDILDGYVARKYRLMTVTGAILDPLADKAIIITVTTTLMIDHSIHWLVGLLICAREILMIAISTVIKWNGAGIAKASQIGKLTTVLYYVAFAVVLFDLADTVFNHLMMLVPLLFSLIASAYYTQMVFKDKKA